MYECHVKTYQHLLSKRLHKYQQIKTITDKYINYDYFFTTFIIFFLQYLVNNYIIIIPIRCLSIIVRNSQKMRELQHYFVPISNKREALHPPLGMQCLD